MPRARSITLARRVGRLQRSVHRVKSAMRLMRGLPAMLFRRRGYAHTAQLLRIILAIEQIPLFAALENFFFLRGNAFARFELGLLFFAQRGGQDLDDLAANGVAVVDEIDVLAGHQHIGELVRDADNFFAAKSHCFEDPRVPKLFVRGSLAFRLSLIVATAGRACCAPTATQRSQPQRRINLPSRANCAFTFLNMSWYETLVRRISSWC